MSIFDVHALDGYSTIASVSGTNPNLTIVVQAGDGAKFGNPQNVVIWPQNTQPLLSNSTVGRISNISTDTLTIVTAQETSSNITVTAGMQIANGITPKVLTDIENATAVSNGVLLSSIFQTTSDTTLEYDGTNLIRIEVDSFNQGTVLEINCPNLTTVSDTIVLGNVTQATTLNFPDLV